MLLLMMTMSDVNQMMLTITMTVITMMMVEDENA